MNEKNLAYLNSQLFYTGFGQRLATELQKSLESGAPAFELYYRAGNDYENLTAALHFTKSRKTDLYFFNSYRLEVCRKNRESIEAQVFFIRKPYHFTLKEAYNLLHGRSVYKTVRSENGESYPTWMRLDKQVMDKKGNYQIEQFSANYGFDLHTELERLPIQEWAHAAEREALCQSLHRGNRQSATLELVEDDIPVFLEANPKYKTIKIYDETFAAVQYVHEDPGGGRLERLWDKKETPPESVEQEARAEHEDKPESDSEDVEKKTGKKKERS